MIRRSTSHGYLLITQNDHANLAAEIATHWGNTSFPAPQPQRSVVDAIEYHDAGWSLHDSEPALNAERRPATFYETPAEYYGRVWVASIAAAAARAGAMGGLIVSWHFSALARSSYERGQLSELAREILERFACTQRVRQAEYCQALRLTPALANGQRTAMNGRDRQALYNLDVLRVCDWLSLLLCADNLPESLAQRRIDLRSRPDAWVTANWIDQATLSISPWPLDTTRLPLSIPARRLGRRRYRRNEDLQREFEHARVETLGFALVASDNAHA